MSYLRETMPAHALGLDRNSYWRFLCRVYGMGALDAWNYVKIWGPPPTVEDVRNAIRKQP